MTDQFDVDVLVIGAGPTGLALTTELTMRGHTVRIVEKNDRTGVQPRAKTTNVRTMTQMRRWGLAQKVRQKSPLDDSFPRDVTFRTSLFDAPIYTFNNAFCASPEKVDSYPEHAEFIPQYVMEGILAEHVAAQPLATLTFGHAMQEFAQDDSGVTAKITNIATGTSETVRAKWIVGADGARSTVRDALGVAMQGQRDMVSFSTLILRIPGLNSDPDLIPALFHWIIDEKAASIIGPMDRNDIWFWAQVADRETDPDVLLANVRRAIGKEFPIEVVTRDDWVVHSLIADRYRQGRAVLVGDACHLHSPFGGHGMNLGIGDAVDLGWKLSAMINGWGTESLIDSYGTERRQAHQAVVDSSTANAASFSSHFVAPDLTDSGPKGVAARAAAAKAIKELKNPEFNSLGLVLGYRYTGSPAFAREEVDGPPLETTVYRPDAHPGHLAPHAWLDDGASLYDRFSTGFTLLCFDDGTPGGDGDLHELARDAGIPLETVVIPSINLATLYGAKLALIRPDQHVAWRGDTLNTPAALISIMRGLNKIDGGESKSS